jgi:hypothetical protein
MRPWAGGLFIEYPNDVCGSLWNQTPHIREVYKGKQVYTYE